jgi:hypothetical protein
MSGKYALIIGNTEYIDPGLAQLTAPGKDTADFARVLKEHELCAFDQVKILLNQLSSTVIEAIDEFFDQKKPDDLLVLYFSGHGVRDEFGSLYLAFKNTIRSRLRSTAVKSDYIREAMDQSRSRRQVVVLDCCNSGAFPQGTKAEVGGAMGMTVAFQGYGRFVLTASDATQFAWEGDKVIGETQNSLFTHFLVKGLEGEADTDGDGKITVDELYDFAFSQISRVTPKQTPTKSSSKQEGEIVLRQITRLEDIKPAPLPAPVLDSLENALPEVRLAAVQQLIRLLNGKNLGLARSAREALQKISENDDSRLVSKAAAQALEAGDLEAQLEGLKTEPAPVAPPKEEPQPSAPPPKSSEPRVPEKLESKEAASATLQQRPRADRSAEEQSPALAKEEVARKKKEASYAPAGEHAAQKPVKRKITSEKPEQRQTDRAARVPAQREISPRASTTESKPDRKSWLAPATLAIAAVALLLCGLGGYAALGYLGIIGGRPAAEQPTSTLPPTIEDIEETSPPSVPGDPENTQTSRPPQADQSRSTATIRPTRTSTPRPTFTLTPRPARGTCMEGYVYRLINSSDKVCVSPASKAQAEADNAAAESRTLLRALVDAYGEQACAAGFVWRGAFDGDLVCVDPSVRQQVIDDNNDAESRRVPGEFTCVTGYVWREAYEGDLVCVFPEVRTQAFRDNEQAASRKAVNVYDGTECLDDYVWRQAFEGDRVCVTPDVYEQVRRDNRDAPNHTWQ